MADMLAVLAMSTTLMTLADQVDPGRLRATVEKLASWHDRNTNNATLDEAAEWIAGEYRKIPGMEVELWRYPIAKGRRVRADRQGIDVIATLPGTSDRRILIGGHFDTTNMTAGEEGQWTLPSPGADDDASGVAMALEVARLLSFKGPKAYRNTLVFVAFSGEEQGLLGSTALAKRAREENWRIDAMLNSDIIGSSRNNAGLSDPRHIRLFSEEIAAGARNAAGEPLPRHNSRELARFIEFTTRKKVKGFAAKLIFRGDRFGRGGDHTPFNRQGFDAVRFCEPYEEYSHQHTEQDLPKFMDFEFLANVARINLLAAGFLADAGDAPSSVRVDPRQGHDTHLTWKGAKDARVVVYWRETTSPGWQFSKTVTPVPSTSDSELLSITIPGVSKDDYVFAVGAIGGIPIEAR